MLHCNAQCRYDDDGGTSLLGLLFHTSQWFFQIVVCVCVCCRHDTYARTFVSSPLFDVGLGTSCVVGTSVKTIRMLGCLFSFCLRRRHTSHMDKRTYTRVSHRVQVTNANIFVENVSRTYVCVLQYQTIKYA